MKTSEKLILNLLSDGRFHSGEELAKKLGITRSAVWKIIHGLDKLEIPIFSLPRKGYQIPDGLELLDIKKITSYLSPTSQEIISLEIFDSIDSTNQYLLNRAKNKQAKSGEICLAEHQTQGHGRKGKEWHSPFGTNLYFSLLWEFNKDHLDLSGLSIATAIAITRMLKHFNIEKYLQLKWPNDILWNYKKLSGILLELIIQPPEKTKVLIGIGLNINMSKYKTHLISQPWADLKGILGKRVDRNLLVGLLINELIKMLDEFESQGLRPFLNEWQQKDLTFEKEVQIQNGTIVQNGIAYGISEKGELLLKNGNEQIVKIVSGDVSLRLA